MKQSSKSVKKTSFASDVLKLVSGTAFAQGLTICASPFLTRLYGPEAFGTLALFVSITSIIGAIACLRYELAIMLPESDEEAANLLGVSLCFVVLISILTVPMVWLGRPIIPDLLKVSPQNSGVRSYSGIHDQPKGLEEDLSRIIVPKGGIFLVKEIRSRIYSRKLIPNLRVVSTRDIKISHAFVPCSVCVA